MKTILCLDPGIAHTGLAVSRESELSEPLTTIFERDLNALVGKLTPFIVQLNPDTIVIGQPSTGPLVKLADELAKHISQIFDGHVVLFNEDLSTKTAQVLMQQSGKNARQRKIDEHQTAAAVILQEYLDSQGTL